MAIDLTVPSTNWGGNITYATSRRHLPTSVDEVASLVRASKRMRALGTRHSFNAIADTDGDLICLAAINRVVALDRSKRTVTVEAGITYGELGTYLHAHGFTVENYPSLPHVCVGGAVQTGTHGSGTTNLSDAVLAIQFVKADGEVIELSRERDADTFDGAVVTLGTLGLVTQLTLAIRESLTIEQDVYEHVPFSDVVSNFDAITTAVYSVSHFTSWQSDRVNQIWFKHDVTTIGRPPKLPFPFLDGRRVTRKIHPIESVAPDFCTEQGVPGPAHERLPHFRADAPPSSAGHELQSEYFIARDDAPDALRAIANIGPRLKDCLMISEVRTIEADELWLSPCYRQRSVAIHFTWEPKQAEVLDALTTLVEPALKPFRARPHWGKLFTLSPAEIQSRYERLPPFRELAMRFDPSGKFRNDFVNRFLFA